MGHSKKRKIHLYDDDYIFGECENLVNNSENSKQRKNRSTSLNMVHGTTHNVKKYIQYFILHMMVTSPKFMVHYDSRTNKKEEEDLLDELRICINKIFYKETHPGLKNNRYLKTMLKNKRRLLVCVIKRIMQDYPFVYDHDALILKYTLAYPGIRPLYQKSYYLNAKRDYNETYKESYPVTQIDERHYHRLINLVKQQVKSVK